MRSWGWGQRGHLESWSERDPVFKLQPNCWVFCQRYKRATTLGGLSSLSSNNTFHLSGEQLSWRNVRQHVSLAFRGSLPHPFEIQYKPINSTLLLVAACMVCILSIRKAVNPAHLFTLTSKGSPHAHGSARNYWHGLLDHEKMEAYGRIHTWTDCFFS